jgi:hypothetical protein
MPKFALRVAECVYYRKEKIIHPYHLIITHNKVTFSRVFATLEEAVKAKERFIQNPSSTK